MVEVLGFKSYIAQGGDWGSVVTSLIGLNHGAKRRISRHSYQLWHGLRANAEPETEEENQWMADAQAVIRQRALTTVQSPNHKP